MERSPARTRPTLGGQIAGVAALLGGAWMMFEGSHRFLTGGFVRVDRLGLWADIVGEAGIDPTDLGSLLVVLGVGEGIGGVGLLLGRRWAWSWSMAFALGTVWFLPVGTLASTLVLLLLLLPGTRAAFRRAL